MGNSEVDNETDHPYNVWMLTRTLWPQVCIISKKRIPMYSKAYLQKSNGCEAWIDYHEFMFARIKGEI